MDFLVYIEHDAENLQFYLWYKDYVRRFEALPEHEKKLSQEWVIEPTELITLARDTEKNEGRKTKTGIDFNDTNDMTDFDGDLKFKDGLSPTISPRSDVFVGGPIRSPTAASILSTSTGKGSGEISGQAGLRWQPCMSNFRRKRMLVLTTIIKLPYSLCEKRSTG